MYMQANQEEKTIRDSLVDALEDDRAGMTDQPVLPLVGSENVSINKEEERDIE